MIKTFVKKPVEVQAVQWTGQNVNEILDFCGGNACVTGNDVVHDYTLTIFTLEGNHEAKTGDWIICGLAGEFYPCKPDIFEQTYREVLYFEEAKHD